MRGRDSRGKASEASGVGAAAKIAGVRGKFSADTDAEEILRTAISIVESLTHPVPVSGEDFGGNQFVSDAQQTVLRQLDLQSSQRVSSHPSETFPILRSRNLFCAYFKNIYQAAASLAQYYDTINLNVGIESFLPHKKPSPAEARRTGEAPANRSSQPRPVSSFARNGNK